MKLILISCVVTAIACGCTHEPEHDLDRDMPSTTTVPTTPPAPTPEPPRPPTPPPVEMDTPGLTGTTDGITTTTDTPPSDASKSQDEIDGDLTRRVRNAIQESPILSELAKQVLIVAGNGVVTLTGAVQHTGDQDQFKIIVPAVPGVLRLEDLTVVKP